ncbi:MAG: glutaredoxin family protein [Desulfovibrio sp.]|jgi:glutaredoxin|nr:glutaredoxin family protein [Desulfovibrio sp.]MBI4961201.1 glutaredoxin family protein [Desulfovibrio sp.]
MNKSVKVFALSTCIHCKHCKEYLDERGQPYECVYVDKLAGDERKNTIEEIKKVNPTLSFPTVMVGDKVIVGFDRQEIDKALEG